MRFQFPFKAILVVLLALFVTTEADAAKQTRSLTGRIDAVEMNRDKVLSVCIVDAEQGRFLLVRGTDVGKELLGQVGATLRVTGVPRKSVTNKDFAEALDVLEYEVLSPAPPRASKEKGRRKPKN